MVTFKCDGCGLCCKHVNALYDVPKGANKAFDELVEQFPYKHDNGVCEKLDLTTNKCTVYDTRPTICQVVHTYHYIKPNCSIEDWLIMNEESCEDLKFNANNNKEANETSID